jgi:signal transduction histidine kinase
VIQAEPRAVSDGPNTTFLVEFEEHPIVGLVPVQRDRAGCSVLATERTGAGAADKQPKALDTIERNATSLTQMVEDVLDISRIVAGKIRLNVQPVDLPDIVRSALDGIAPAAEAKGIRMESILVPHASPISGGPARLQQIFWNLLSNAVKFTNRGGKVQVRLERVNSHMEVSVSDTGIAITAEFLPHVFERFRQSDAGTTREWGGLGLGLAIARQTAEMHGGTIDVSSAGTLGCTEQRVSRFFAHAASDRRTPIRLKFCNHTLYF